MKKLKKTSTAIVALSITCIIAYTVAAIWVQYCTGMEVSTTLTTSVFAFFGVELISLAGIKITKVRADYDGECFNPEEGEE